MATERPQSIKNIKVISNILETKDQRNIAMETGEIIKNKARKINNVIPESFTVDKCRDNSDELVSMEGLQISQREEILETDVLLKQETQSPTTTDNGLTPKLNSYNTDYKTDSIDASEIINQDVPKHSDLCETSDVTSNNSQRHLKSVDGPMVYTLVYSNNQDAKEIEGKEIANSEYQYNMDNKISAVDQRSESSFSKTNSMISGKSTTSRTRKFFHPCVKATIVTVETSMNSDSSDPLKAPASIIKDDSSAQFTVPDASLETGASTYCNNQMIYNWLDDKHESYDNEDVDLTKAPSPQPEDDSSLSSNSFHNSLETDGPTSCQNMPNQSTRANVQENYHTNVSTGKESNSILIDKNSKDDQKHTPMMKNSKNVTKLNYIDHCSSNIQEKTSIVHKMTPPSTSQKLPQMQHSHRNTRAFPNTKRQAEVGKRKQLPSTGIGAVSAPTQHHKQGDPQKSSMGNGVVVPPCHSNSSNIHKTQLHSTDTLRSCVASDYRAHKTQNIKNINSGYFPEGTSVTSGMTSFHRSNQNQGHGYFDSDIFRYPSAYGQRPGQPQDLETISSHSMNNMPSQQFSSQGHYFQMNFNNEIDSGYSVNGISQAYPKNVASQCCSTTFSPGSQIPLLAKRCNEGIQRVEDWLYRDYTLGTEAEKCDPCSLGLTGESDHTIHQVYEGARYTQAMSDRQTEAIGLFNGKPLPVPHQSKLKQKSNMKSCQQHESPQYYGQKYRGLNSILSDTPVMSTSSHYSDCPECMKPEAFVHSQIDDPQIKRIGQKQLPMYKQSIYDQAEEINKTDWTFGQDKGEESSKLKLETFNKGNDRSIQGFHDSVYKPSSDTEYWEQNEAVKREDIQGRLLEYTQYKYNDNTRTSHIASNDICPRQVVSKQYETTANITGREEHFNLQEQKAARGRKSDIYTAEIRNETAENVTFEMANNYQKLNTSKQVASSKRSENVNPASQTLNHNVPIKHPCTVASQVLAQRKITSTKHSKDHNHNIFHEYQGVPPSVAGATNVQPTFKPKTQNHQQTSINYQTQTLQKPLHSTTLAHQSKESNVTSNVYNAYSNNIRSGTVSSGKRQSQCVSKDLQKSNVSFKVQSSLETPTNQPSTSILGDHEHVSHPKFIPFSYSQSDSNENNSSTCMFNNMNPGMSRLAQSSSPSAHLNNSNFKRQDDVAIPTASPCDLSAETYLNIPCFQSIVARSDAPVNFNNGSFSSAAISLNAGPTLPKQQQQLVLTQQLQEQQYQSLQTHHQQLIQQIRKTKSTKNAATAAASNMSSCKLLDQTSMVSQMTPPSKIYPLMKESTQEASSSYISTSSIAAVQPPSFLLDSESRQNEAISTYINEHYSTHDQITGLLPDDDAQNMPSLLSVDSSMEQCTSLFRLDDFF